LREGTEKQKLGKQKAEIGKGLRLKAETNTKGGGRPNVGD
jgi:hypothetical protein